MKKEAGILAFPLGHGSEFEAVEGPTVKISEKTKTSIRRIDKNRTKVGKKARDVEIG